MHTPMLMLERLGLKVLYTKELAVVAETGRKEQEEASQVLSVKGAGGC